MVGWRDGTLKCKQVVYRAGLSLLILLTASRAKSILIRDRDGWFATILYTIFFLDLLLKQENITEDEQPKIDRISEMIGANE